MMLDFRGAWQDGQAGTAWISGLHIADWVRHHPKTRNKDKIEFLFLEMESVLDQGKYPFQLGNFSRRKLKSWKVSD